MRHSLFASEEINPDTRLLRACAASLFSLNNYVCLDFLRFPQ